MAEGSEEISHSDTERDGRAKTLKRRRPGSKRATRGSVSGKKPARPAAAGTGAPTRPVSASQAVARKSAIDDLPVSIYLQDDRGPIGEQVRKSVAALLAELGYGLIPESGPVIGSWWQRFKAKASSPEAKSALLERIDKLERVADAKYLSIPEGQANLLNSQSFMNVLTALKGESNAVIQLGPLIVLKVTKDGESGVYCKTLTPTQLRLIDRRPSLLQQPSTLLGELAALEPEPQEGRAEAR